MLNQETEAVAIDEQTFAEHQQAFTDVLTRYYGDPDFRLKFETNPTGVLQDSGVPVPDDTKVELLYNTDKLVHIVLPYVEGE